LIEELGLQGSTFGFVGRTWPAGLSDDEIVRRAWDLDGVAARYEKLIARFENVEPEPGDDVLLTYLALIHEWRRFPFIDPQLPDDLLPDWIGRRATELFVNRRKRWAAAVDVRWQEILALNSPVS
jgi:phenylacetic acid degradation operon negative regulatory protein